MNRKEEMKSVKMGFSFNDYLFQPLSISEINFEQIKTKYNIKVSYHQKI